MAKKRTNKKPNVIPKQETSSLLDRVLELIQPTSRRISHSRINSKITYSGTSTFSGTTKTWLNDFRRCRGKQQHQYPQLVDITDPDIGNDYNKYFAPCIPPPPGLGNMNTLLKFASLRSYYIRLPPLERALVTCKIILTNISNPAFMVYTCPHWYGRDRPEIRVVTHKSTEIDPYDANNQVMKFSYVIKSLDGKYYAVSLQGALVVMEQVDDKQIIITGKCGTRAVPSSMGAKAFTEYLFESKGEILLAFLIYKESLSKLPDEIEVFRFDVDTLKLVKVDKLQGRALFLEYDACVWVDSKEVGCKGDSVYFTGGSGYSGEWRVYDMKNGSISDGVYFTGRPGSNGNWRVFDMKNEYISDDSWGWIEFI